MRTKDFLQEFSSVVLLNKPTKKLEDQLTRYHGKVYTLDSNFHPSSNPVTSIHITPEDQRAITECATTTLLEYAQKECSGQSLIRRLQFDDKHSLWYYVKFRLFFKLEERLRLVFRINHLAGQGKVLVVALDENILLGQEDSGVYIDVDHATSIPTQKKVKKFVLKSLIEFIYRALFGMANLSKLKKAKYLFLFDRSMLQFISVDGKRKGWFNPVLSYLEQTRIEESCILLDFQLPKEQSDPFLQTQIKAKNIVRSESVLLLGFIKILPFLMTRKVIKKLTNQLDIWRLQNEDGVGNFMFKEIRTNWGYYSFHLFRYFAYRSVLKYSKSEVCITRDENNPLARAFWQAGEANGKLSVGIQHGNIAFWSPAYLSNTYDHKYFSSYPKLEFLWGERWRDFLMNTFELPEHKIEVCGQLRSDVIFRMRENSSNKDFVLFATQPIPNLKLRKLVDDIVYQSMKEKHTVQFVLKPHPRQIGKNEFDRFAKLPNCIVEESEDLYHLLSNSKGLITSFSTVGTEAIYFNVPLLLVDPHKSDTAGYIRQGVGLQSMNSIELSDQISRLDNPTFTNNLKVNYEAFIRSYAYKVDGEVAKRIWSAIDRRIGCA